MNATSDRLRSLRPVTFQYKSAYKDGGKPMQFGLIAEEVAEVFPELVVFNEYGEPETVKYQHICILLLNEFQKGQAKAAAASAALRQENVALAHEVAQLKAQFVELNSLRAELQQLRDLTAQLAQQQATSGRTVSALSR